VIVTETESPTYILTSIGFNIMVQPWSKTSAVQFLIAYGIHSWPFILVSGDDDGHDRVFMCLSLSYCILSCSHTHAHTYPSQCTSTWGCVLPMMAEASDGGNKWWQLMQRQELRHQVGFCPVIMCWSWWHSWKLSWVLK